MVRIGAWSGRWHGIGVLTLATEDDGQIPQFGHVERFEDLALIGGAIAVEGEGRVVFSQILVGERQAGTDGDLCADDAITAEEALGEHVHRSSFAVSNAFSPSEQLANDGLDGASAHESEAVTSVGGDDVVFFGNGVLDAGCYRFLAGGQMAETSDLLLFVESICCHLHSPVVSALELVRPVSRGVSYRMVTISQYICLSSFFVVARVYGGGSNSYVSKLSSESLTSNGFSSS